MDKARLIWKPDITKADHTIWTPAPMQTPSLDGDGRVKTPEKFLTFLLPRFLDYLNQQLGRNSKSYLAFNGVGLSIQKKAKEAMKKNPNLGIGCRSDADFQYAYNTHQISTIIEWLDKRFGIEDFELFRDDDPDFREYILQRVIPYLFDQGKIEIKQKFCNVCSDCGNIISVAEVESTAPCNACGSTNKEQKELDVLVGYFDGNVLYQGVQVSEPQPPYPNLSYMKTMFKSYSKMLEYLELIGCSIENGKIIHKGLKDRFVTKIPHSLKGFYTQLPTEVLLSRTNRNNGIPLDRWGLKNQFLDPEMVLGLYASYVRSWQNQNVVIFQGANTATRVMPYDVAFNPFAENNYYGLHPKIPLGTFDRFLTGKNPATIPFLTKYLPLVLANSNAGFKDLTEAEIDKLWKEFSEFRRKILLYFVFQGGYKMGTPAKPKGYMGGNLVSKLYIPPESNGKPNIPNLGTLKNLNIILSTCMQAELTKLDMNKILPLIKSFFMLSPDSEELKYPEIRESLKQYIKANPILKQRIVTFVHFGSTATGDNKPDSDLDLNLIVDKIDKEVIPEIQKMILKLKKSFPDNKFDFSFRSVDEFENPDDTLIEYKHGTHGIDFLSSINNTGEEIYGQQRGFDQKLLKKYNNNSVPILQIPDSFEGFKQYHFNFRQAVLEQDPRFQYKKYFGRALYMFLSQVGIDLPKNLATSDFQSIFELFKTHFGDAYNNLEIIDNYLKQEDDHQVQPEELTAMLMLLEDLMRVQNKFINPEFDVEKDLSLQKIKSRDNKGVSLYKDEVGNYIKIGNISLLKEELNRNSKLRKLGFELPQQKTGIYQILPSGDILCYAEEKDLGDDYYSLMNQQKDEETNYFIPISEILINHARKQMEIRLTEEQSLGVPEFLQTHIESLNKSATLPDDIKSKLDNFIIKLITRLGELPKVWSHNDLHTKNITEGGIIDWEHAGINYFGYDLVLPFFINETLEFSKEAQEETIKNEYFSYLSRIKYHTKIDLNNYLNDFIALKVLLLCVDIEDREDLQNVRYPLLSLTIDRYINDKSLVENLFKQNPNNI